MVRGAWCVLLRYSFLDRSYYKLLLERATPPSLARSSCLAQMADRPVVPSPFGVSNVAGATVPEKRGFFRAAAEFFEAAPWNLLRQTRHRQFSCTLLPLEGEGAIDDNRTPRMCDAVELYGLSSEAGQKLNGLRGEIVQPLPRGPPGEEEPRWSIRLLADGRTVRAKRGNIRMTSTGTDCVIKIAGGDGGDVGLMVYKSWAAFWHGCDYLPPNAATESRPPPSDNGTSLLMIAYFSDSNDTYSRDLTQRDEALCRRLKAPLAARAAGGVGGMPVFYGLSEGPEQQPVTAQELRLAEAGLLAAVRFVRMLAEAPHPPKPYFCPTSFEPREELLEAVSAGGIGRVVRMRCTFPSGNLPCTQHKWCSCPEPIRRFAPRPGHVCSIQDAMDYHRDVSVQISSDVNELPLEEACERGDFRRYAHLFGLANALWEAEEPEERVHEAITIGHQLIAAFPADDYEVRKMLMQWLLEVGDWDDALKLLAQFPDDATEPWLWTAVLVTLKAKGPSSKSARAALKRALQLNPEVLPLLLGEKPTASGEWQKARLENGRYAESEGGGVVAITARQNAVCYSHNYAKFWFCDQACVEWLRTTASKDGLEKKCTAKYNTFVGVKLEKAQADKVVAGLVCAMCGSFDVSGKTPLKQCVCRVVAYCSKDCQKAHWKKHKKSCSANKKGKLETPAAAAAAPKLSESEKAAGSWSGTDDPTWSRLTKRQLKDIRSFHEGCRCTVAWPISAETPAMLNHPTYSFLRSHPNMKWKCDVIQLPGGFQMAYNGEGVDRDVISELHGQTAAHGQAAFVLKEDLSACSGPDATKKYFARVPPHDAGQRMQLCLIAEVGFTRACEFGLNDFYRPQGPNAGKCFEWPGIDAIVTCPGTGEKVKPDGGKRMHLLVAHSISGYQMHGSKLEIFDRIIPRILTIEGHERLMGGEPGSANRFVEGEAVHADGTQEITRNLVYPDALRRTTNAKAPKRLQPMSQAWEGFHESGRYLMYERYVQEQRICARNAGSRSDVHSEASTRGHAFGDASLKLH